MVIIFSNSGGECDREPVIYEGYEEPDAVREAIERLVARISIFYAGDSIKVVDVS